MNNEKERDTNRDAGRIAALTELLLTFRTWTTRLTKAAYRKGAAAGIDGAQPWDDGPYAQGLGHTNNHWRSGNDPREAWKDGVRDGRRIASLLTDPASVEPPCGTREARIIGYVPDRELRNVASHE